MDPFTIDPAVVQRAHLFASLDDTQLQAVLNNTTTVDLVEGQSLFEMGQCADRFFLLVSGQVKLFRLSRDGNEKIVELIQPGGLFAEAVIFMEHPRYPVNAMALKNSLLYGFRSDTFRQSLLQSPPLCLSLLGDLSMRLCALVDEIDRLTLKTATYRVVHYLADLIPDPHTNSAVIELPVARQVLAASLSVAPETLSRILHGMARERIISIHGKSIGVHDVQRLRTFGDLEENSTVMSHH